MSVPLVNGYNKIDDIINKLKAQEFNYTEINQVIKDFKGTKREDEMLNFLIENRNKKLTIQEVLKKKKEIFERYDEMWGYIPTEKYSNFPFDPLYMPIEYQWHEEEYNKLNKCIRYRKLTDVLIKDIFEIRDEILKNDDKDYEKVWKYIKENTDKTKYFYTEIYQYYCENRLYVNNVLHTYGNVEDNDKKLKCPKCMSRYVGMHICVALDNKILKNIGLYDNPLDYYSTRTNTYYCLSCGNEW